MANTPNNPGASSEEIAAAQIKRRRLIGGELTAQRLHPVQVEYSLPYGVRMDMDRELPPDISDEDPEELLDLFSAPPTWVDRIAPVSVTVGGEQLTGRNPLEVELKFFHRLASDIGDIAKEMSRTNTTRFGEKGAVSFLGLGIDPDTAMRIIDYDYETADNTYSRLDGLFAGGHVTPIATTPFHTLLPLYKHDFDIRFLVRIALDFYWPLFKKHSRAVAKNLGEKYFIAVFWLPDGAISARVLQILHAEFVKRCEAEGIAPAHLVLLLDTEQSREREIELLMKRWNTMRPSATTRDIVTVMFRERAFSDWVMNGHPSTKKQLDRTIAKVDAVLRDAGKDHLWSHFEPTRTLLGTFKMANNFNQKLLKLTELGYQPAAPDVFVRRKLLEVYGLDETEPRRTQIADNTTWSAWPETPGSLSRLRGVEENGQPPAVRLEAAEARPYIRIGPGGVQRKEPGSPCWKHALHCALTRVQRAVIGEPKAFIGGMLGLLRELTPIERVPVAMRNIEDFLVASARIRFREHYVAHVCSEADIQLAEFCRTILLKDADEDGGEAEMTEEQMVSAGVAAEAIFLSHEGLSSCAFHAENLDQRAAYQNVALMTLAVVHAIHAYNWNEKTAEAKELFGIFKEELLDFEGAFKRHNLEALGFDRKAWDKAIRSEVDDSPLNLVTRAARRVAAKHLRNAGFRAEFQRTDEMISATTGHMWSIEIIDQENWRWENENSCGLHEE